MYPKFVQTANVTRFLAGIAAVEARAAPEATILLVSGTPGHGKSRIGSWWATQTGAVFLRLKAATSPHWVLTDLVTELGESAPAYASERMFAQAVGALTRQPRPIVVDEVENGLNDIKVLDTLRDVCDLTEVPTVWFGREYVWSKLKRYKQLASRISARADFAPLSLDDVAGCVQALCEVDVHPDVVAEIHRQSEGVAREMVKAIKSVERLGKRARAQVTLEMVGRDPLIHDWQRPALRSAK